MFYYVCLFPGNTHDHQSAFKLWKYLIEKKINPSRNILNTLTSVYNINNIDIPDEILQYNKSERL